MRVYHGSPYRFTAFSPEHIGRGEGAQVYGYGHYVAQEPDVAKGYAANLANRDITNQNRLNAHANAQRLVKLAGDPSYAADDIQYVLESQPEHPQSKLLNDTLQFIRSGDYAKPLANNGFFYAIEIPDHQIAKMLDWDKPLSQQTPQVQAAIRKADLIDESVWPHYTGEQLYQGEMNANGPWKANGFASNEAAPNISALLHAHGIAGIRYLDGGSRGAGEGTCNFVIFPGCEHLLTITHCNGEPIEHAIEPDATEPCELEFAPGM